MVVGRKRQKTTVTRIFKKPLGINNLTCRHEFLSIWFIKAFIVYNKFVQKSNIVHLQKILKNFKKYVYFSWIMYYNEYVKKNVVIQQKEQKE